MLHRAGDGQEDVGPTFIWLPLLVAIIFGHPDACTNHRLDVGGTRRKPPRAMSA